MTKKIIKHKCDKTNLLIPVINQNKCEGKGDCIRVCPYDVFEMGEISKEEKSQLSFKGKIKAWVHGGKQAFVIKSEACLACGLCLDACPESALSLQLKPD